MENSTSGTNKFFGYAIAIVIGIAIGYFICNKTSTGKGAVAVAKDTTAMPMTNSDTTSHKISDSLAQVLMTDFEAENKIAEKPLKNNKGELLRGYFIDRQPLDKILKDPAVSGISVFFGIDSLAHKLKKTDRIYTLIYMGGKYNMHYKVGGTEPKILNFTSTSDSSQYDFVKPCPESCGTSLSLYRKAHPTAKK